MIELRIFRNRSLRLRPGWGFLVWAGLAVVLLYALGIGNHGLWSGCTAQLRFHPLHFALHSLHTMARQEMDEFALAVGVHLLEA